MNSLRLAVLTIFFVLVAPVHASSIVVGVADGNTDVLSWRDGRFVGKLGPRYQCVFDNTKLDFVFRTYPHARILHNLESGDIDIGLPLVRVSDRDRYAVFASGILDVDFLLFSSKPIDPDADLTGHTFTVRRSTASKDLVLERNGRFEEVSSWSQAVELAQMGRFDGVVIPEIIANGLPAEQYDGLHRSRFGTIPLSLYVSRQSSQRDELVARFNQAVADCRQ